MKGNAFGFFYRHAAHMLAPMMLLFAGCAAGPYPETVIAPPPPSLAGTHWTVVTIDGHDAQRGSELSADFSVDGRVTGDTGCNSFSGAFVQNGATVNFGELLSSRRACDAPDRQRQEDRMMDILRGPTTVQLVRDELQVHGRDGSITLLPSIGAVNAAYVATPSGAPLAGRKVRYECQGIVIDVDYGEDIARLQAPDSYDVLKLKAPDSGPMRYESAHSELRFREHDMLWGREGAPPRSCVERQ